MPTEDPKTQLRRLTESGKIPIRQATIDRANDPQAAIMLMLHDQNVEGDRKFGDVFKQLREFRAEENDKHVATQARLQSIEGKQDHTNGDVTTLKGEVILLKQAEADRQKASTIETIQEQARMAAVKGVWVIPKPSKTTLSVAGAVIVFMGSDRVLFIIGFLWRFAKSHL